MESENALLKNVLDSEIQEIEYDFSDEMEHYGVKGMKWGVRKDRVSGSGKRSSKGKTTQGIRRKSVKKNKKSGSRFFQTVRNGQSEIIEIRNPDGSVSRVEYDPSKLKVDFNGGKLKVSGRKSEISKFKNSLKIQSAPKSKNNDKGLDVATKYKNLDNSELQARVDRLRLERAYSELVNTPKRKNFFEKGLETYSSTLLNEGIRKVAVPMTLNLINKKLSTNISSSGIKKATKGITDPMKNTKVSDQKMSNLGDLPDLDKVSFKNDKLPSDMPNLPSIDEMLKNL